MSWLTDKLFGTSELQAEGSADDAKLAAMNKDAYERGLWDNKQYAQATKDAQDGATGDVSEQVYQSFKEGLPSLLGGKGDSALDKTVDKLSFIALVIAGAYVLVNIKK